MAKMLPLQQLMNSTLREFGLEKKARSYSIITSWEEIVGERVASVTTPEKVDKGVLVVRVQSPVWKYELTMRKKEILAKIRSHSGTNEVTDIQWK